MNVLCPFVFVARMSHALIFATLLVAVGGLAIRGRGRAHPQASRSTNPVPDKVVAPEKVALAAPWMHAVKRALNHGGTQRKQRDRSAAKRKHVQLATVDPLTGRPSCRTVVFRGFLPRKYVDGLSGGEESCCLAFITDDRSEKVRHLAADGAPVEVCWWLDEPGVQFRISGHAHLARAGSKAAVLRAAADEVWNRLGESSKRTFYWPAPGAPREALDATTPKNRAAAAEGEHEDSGSMEASHFVLLIVVPESVDELHLGGNQRRITHRRELGGAPFAGEGKWPLARISQATWTEQAVNP